MKKAVLMAALVAILLPAIGVAQPGPKLGVGGFAGLSLPVVQDDQELGNEFGLRGRLGLANLIVVEPYVSFVSWGAPDNIDGVDFGIDGSKLTSFGIEASLGNTPGQMGVSPFFFAGLGSYKVKNDDTGYDQSKLGFSGGLGIGIGVSPKFALDFRGKVVVAPQEEGGSKKAVGITAGLNFNFGVQ